MKPNTLTDFTKAANNAARDQSDLAMPPWQDVVMGLSVSLLLWTGFALDYFISGTPLSLGRTISASIGCALIGVILSYHFAHIRVNSRQQPI